MKKKLSPKLLSALVIFSLIGQVAWIVENMYLNVFIYNIFSASASDISLMVSASAISATLTTIFMGALSDRLGKRKLFICLGYILWGISILCFAHIRVDIISKIIPTTVSAASVGVLLVIIFDCIMTFFGSSANDAAFNAWLTDSTNSSNRGAAEGINSMMPLVAILVVFGGFMSFDLNLVESWSTIFIIIGIVVLIAGVLGIFIIKEPTIEKAHSGYLKTLIYEFTPKAFKSHTLLYLCLLAFIIFNISIQIFMPYLIIYYEVSLQMTDYVLVMAPAIVLASVVTFFWGKVYDKKGFRFSALVSVCALILGYAILYLTRTTIPVFIGSLLMMSGYLSGMAVFGAKIRDNTPEGKAGSFQGARIFSQVLIPGIIGPAIASYILRDAETIIGSDGREGFIPSADIFLAAIVPAALLIPFIFILSKKKVRTVKLDTSYDLDEIPFNVYPRPTLKRDSFINLNGKWDFEVLRNGKSDFKGEITVPYPPESQLSNVERITKKGDTLIYTRTFDVSFDKNKKQILNFGAVDNFCEVYINEKKVGEHIGGYLPFSFDVSSYIYSGKNTIKVLVTDSLDTNFPYGKQTHKRGGMWYTSISGIWQTVWLEEVPLNYIKSLDISTTLNSVKIKANGAEGQKTLFLGDLEISFEDEIEVELSEPVLWTPENPYINEFEIVCGEDRVKSYFAVRTISIEKRNGQSYIFLNGEPYFFHGVLDQGYYPDGIFTPKSEKAFIDDILKLKELGFNMLRKHIKIEPEIFYYYCDIYGIAVFQDMVNNAKYSFIYDTALPTINLKKLPKFSNKKARKIFINTAKETIEHLKNHPSVVYYTIFNEGWGQFDSDKVYDILKPLDKSRIFDTASGWFRNKKSDVQSEHVYFKKADFEIDKSKPSVLSEFGGYSLNIEGHSFNLDKVYGYKKFNNREEFSKALYELYKGEVIPLIKKGLGATVLTQLSDVEDETNGVLTYDRKIVKPLESDMQKISTNIQKAFSDATCK